MTKKSASPEDGPAPITLHTCPINPDQANKLHALLQEQGWKFETRPYTRYFAQKDKLTLALYEKGPKCVIQGRGTEEFVKFTLEPEILGEARLGYDEIHHPDWFEPHIGVDESGKGDFFGPLVIAGCYTNAEAVRGLVQAGVTDSKKIGSDSKIRELADIIRHTEEVASSVVCIGPEKYNAIYKKFGNLNKLLAWGHARVIENVLELQPDCPRALSDQFANPVLIKRALLERGQGIVLDARTKAESDPAVAAASILAREAFIDWMDKTSRQYAIKIPRGASALVKTVATEIASQKGTSELTKLVKTHFKTAYEVAPETFPESKPKPKDYFRR